MKVVVLAKVAQTISSIGMAGVLPAVLLVTTITFKCGIKVSVSTPYNDEQCTFALERETDTQLFYRFLELPFGATHVNFEVKASSGVYIGLFPSKRDSEFYEIVIGGWNNTQSLIRRCSYPPPGDGNGGRCKNKKQWETMQFLNQNELRHFQIDFDSNGEISVGQNYTGVSFMNWKDADDPLTVQFIGYSTGYGSAGIFRFCNIEQCSFALERETDTQLFYRFLELPFGATHVNFEVKASSDVYVGLFPSKRDSEFYEIVIGGWNNTQSLIRRCSYPPPGDENSGRCKKPKFEETMEFLNEHELRHFQIDFDSNGEISVGRNYTGVSFMNWKDADDPLTVQFIGYSTGYGSEGLFRFCNIVIDPDSDITSTSTSSPLFMNTTYASEETNLENRGKPLLWATVVIFVVLILTTMVVALVIKRTKLVSGKQKQQIGNSNPSFANPTTLAEHGSYHPDSANYETVRELEGAKPISVIHTYHETDACNKSFHPRAPYNFADFKNEHITKADERTCQPLDGKQNEMKRDGKGYYMQYICKT